MTRARDVASNGGLVLINSTTFSAQSSVSINNVFTSTYTNYKLVLNIAYSVDTALRGRLRVNGTDDISNKYIMQNLGASTTSVTASRASTTNWEFQQTATGTASGNLDIFSPQETALTRATFHFSGAATTTAEIVNVGNGFFNGTTSFDSITLSTASGTMTGTIKFYGYKN